MQAESSQLNNALPSSRLDMQIKHNELMQTESSSKNQFARRGADHAALGEGQSPQRLKTSLHIYTWANQEKDWNPQWKPQCKEQMLNLSVATLRLHCCFLNCTRATFIITFIMPVLKSTCLCSVSRYSKADVQIKHHEFCKPTRCRCIKAYYTDSHKGL